MVLRESVKGDLAWKPWSIQSNSAKVKRWFRGLRCSNLYRHESCPEDSERWPYPRPLARRTARGIMQCERIAKDISGWLSQESFAMNPQSSEVDNSSAMNPQNSEVDAIFRDGFSKVDTNAVTDSQKSKVKTNFMTDSQKSKVDTNAVTDSQKSKVKTNFMADSQKSKVDTNFLTVSQNSKGPDEPCDGFTKVKSGSEHRERFTKSKVVPSIVEDSESIQPDIMDQSSKSGRVGNGHFESTVQRTLEQCKRVDATLHELHCNSGHCSNQTLADRLRRDGAPQWVCKRAVELTCDTCESRKPSQP